MVSSLKNCLRQKEGQPPGELEEPSLADVWPSRSKTPRRRRGTSTKRDLAKAREAHQRALATVATLEEKIERQSWSITRGWLDTHAHSQSHDCQRRRSWGQSRRCCRALLEESPALPPEYSPPQWGPGAREDEEAGLPFLDFDLELLPELGPDVNCFLQELTGSVREDDGNDSSPEPPAGEDERWVTWQGQVLDMPDWWQELAEISEVDDHGELAQKVWASFELPQQISKQHGVKN